MKKSPVILLLVSLGIGNYALADNWVKITLNDQTNISTLSLINYQPSGINKWTTSPDGPPQNVTTTATSTFTSGSLQGDFTLIANYDIKENSQTTSNSIPIKMTKTSCLVNNGAEYVVSTDKNTYTFTAVISNSGVVNQVGCTITATTTPPTPVTKAIVNIHNQVPPAQ